MDSTAADDESIAKNIRDGFPDKGMAPFKDPLTDAEIWQMVAYIRTTAASLKEKPVYVPDPDGQVVTSQKQTFRIEIVARNLETPWGLAFLPDGRLLITERPGRLRIVEKGKLLPEPVKGTPKVWEKQDGGLLDVEVHPEYARTNGWIYLSYSETLAGLRPARAGRPGRATRAPDPPSMTVVVRGRINRNNEWVDQQLLFRAPERDLQLQQRALRIAIHLRPAESSVLLARREAADHGLAGPVEADRQDPSHQ